jgi:hypothetical protein
MQFVCVGSMDFLQPVNGCGTYVLDELNFCQPNTCDALMLFGAEICNLGSMTGLGNFCGV